MCHHELGAYNLSLIYEFEMLFVHFSSDVFGCVVLFTYKRVIFHSKCMILSPELSSRLNTQINSFYVSKQIKGNN